MTDSRKSFGTATLVSFEMIFSCFLLVLSGVTIGSSIDSANTDYGTTIAGYLTGQIDLTTDSYDESSARNTYRQNLQQELIEQEGITGVSFTTALPSQYGNGVRYDLEDQDVMIDDQYPLQNVVHIATNYFETMDVGLRAGRNFDGTDTVNSLPVVIVDELFAAQHWSEQSALGKRIQIDPGTAAAQFLTVVGVTPHIVQGFVLDVLNAPSLYRPMSQSCCTNSGRIFNVVLKVNGSPNNYRQTLQQAAASADRDVPVSNISSLTGVLETSNSIIIFVTEAFSGMAFITLMLAITGIYAIVSRSVRQRTKEIGIRRAIGSSNGRVHWVFIKQGLRYLGLGLLIGGGGAALTINAILSDSVTMINWLPLVFVSVSLVLGLLVFIATYNPARFLLAMEPGETLRDE